MKEALLHYIWKTKSFPFLALKTTEGDSITIQHFGYHNSNSGPDFLEGGIQISNTQWRGHIEIHVLSSDWNRHEHGLDEAYDNVILHVVWEEDEIIYRKDGSRIPCLELRNLISPLLLQRYERFSKRTDQILCGKELLHRDQSLFFLQLNRMAIERLEEKSLPLSLELEHTHQDWSQLLFWAIAKSFGLKVNASAMESFARRIPINLVLKHVDQLFQLEALFYGQAGMLSANWRDVYAQSLYKEYQFLQNKYDLQALSGKEWKLMRMRPSAFPTIRLSQLAAIYYKNPDLHAKILYAPNVHALKELFVVSASSYWDSHYLFDRNSKQSRLKVIGESTIRSIIINGVIPFMFSYARYRMDDSLLDKALELLESMKSEQNKIIKEWKRYNIIPKNAFESQALIQLKKHYCDQKRCLSCSYGSQLISKLGTI